MMPMEKGELTSRGQVTLSTHNGSQVSFGHNLRLPEFVKNQPHIDPNGKHETWIHEDLKDFYDRVFQPYADAYDCKARSSRRVGNYLEMVTKKAIETEAKNDEIKARNKEHKAKGEPQEKLLSVKKPIYEMIVGVYPKGGLKLSEAEQYAILDLWFYGDGTPEHPSFQERNPNMKVVGCYYHADEPDAEPHLHMDYVPVGQCSRGMKVQNSIEQALKGQGMGSGMVPGDHGKSYLMTAQERFQTAENAYLQTICEENGLEVIRTQRGKKSQHLSTAEKKRRTEAEKLVADAKAEAEGIVRQAQENAAARRCQILGGLSDPERNRLEELESLLEYCETYKFKNGKSIGDYIRNAQEKQKKESESTQKSDVSTPVKEPEYRNIFDGVRPSDADLARYMPKRTEADSGRHLPDTSGIPRQPTRDDIQLGN